MHVYFFFVMFPLAFRVLRRITTTADGTSKSSTGDDVPFVAPCSDDKEVQKVDAMNTLDVSRLRVHNYYNAFML